MNALCARPAVKDCPHTRARLADDDDDHGNDEDDIVTIIIVNVIIIVIVIAIVFIAIVVVIITTITTINITVIIVSIIMIIIAMIIIIVILIVIITMIMISILSETSMISGELPVLNMGTCMGLLQYVGLCGYSPAAKCSEQTRARALMLFKRLEIPRRCQHSVGYYDARLQARISLLSSMNSCGACTPLSVSDLLYGYSVT